MFVGLAVLLPAFAEGEELSSKATATTKDQTLQSCKPCSDGDAPVACKGEDLGKRLDDSRVYRDSMPPSSELSVVPPIPMQGSAVIPSSEPAQALQPMLQQPEKKIEIVQQAPPVVMMRMNDMMGGSLFATNKAELRPEAIKQLDVLAESLRGKRISASRL
jgi:outer membrane protein OmpA-like peptidoglycan-associated protein